MVNAYDLSLHFHRYRLTIHKTKVFLDLNKNSKRVELKQVKDACKKFMTPSITLKNWRKNNLGNYEPPFDYLIVVDVDRKAMLVFDSNYVSDKTENNDATVTCKLELSKAVQTETLNSLL